MPDIVAIFIAVALIGVANGAPIFARNLLGERFGWPLDGNLHLPDGQPLFGASKTARGLVTALLVTSLLAPLLGIPAQAGFVIAALAMTGDLLSSFIKRRLNLPPSSRATGLDQIPEALLPALAAKSPLSLDWGEVGIVVGLFFIGNVLISRLLYRLKIRRRPY